MEQPSSTPFALSVFSPVAWWAFAALLLYGWFGIGLYLGLWKGFLSNPTAAFSYAGILLIYWGSGASRQEFISLTAAGAMLRLWAERDAPALTDFPLAVPAQIGAFAGYLAVASLIARVGFGSQRAKSATILARLLIFVFLGIALGQILSAASRIRPWKLDEFLYALDRGYGPAASHTVAAWFAASSSLRYVEFLVYYSLPLALALLYALHVRRPWNKVDILQLLYANALIGFGLYLLYPACGPIYAFPATFPFSAPSLPAPRRAQCS